MLRRPDGRCCDAAFPWRARGKQSITRVQGQAVDCPELLQIRLCPQPCCSTGSSVNGSGCNCSLYVKFQFVHTKTNTSYTLHSQFSTSFQVRPINPRFYEGHHIFNSSLLNTCLLCKLTSHFPHHYLQTEQLSE